VLLALREDLASLRELVATLGSSKQAVFKLAEAMADAGLVERVPDPLTVGRRTCGSPNADTVLSAMSR